MPKKFNWQKAFDDNFKHLSGDTMRHVVPQFIDYVLKKQARELKKKYSKK